jgi:hypothetical protein
MHTARRERALHFTIRAGTAVQTHLLTDALSLTLRRGTIHTARREHTFDRPTILDPTVVHAHLLAHISSRVDTRVCVALLLIDIVRRKVARYTDASSDNRYLKRTLTIPTVTISRADAPVAPVADAVHRALMLVAGLVEIIAI